MPVTRGPISLIEGGQNMPGGLAVDASFVYWTNTGSGEFMRAPK